VEALPRCVERLLAYAGLLARWNAAFNLVGRADIHRLVPRHIVDALQLLPLVRPTRLLDIGSGAGLPGLVLAIAHPGIAVTLLERMARRARFLELAARELGLDNVTVVNGDALRWRAAQGFDTVTARAVASGDVLGELVAPHLAADGVLVAQFGARQDDSHIPSGFHVLDRREYMLPDNPAAYRLLVLRCGDGRAHAGADSSVDAGVDGRAHG
jgi:16S rRNA (guanine527-N7)-methyltransferase